MSKAEKFIQNYTRNCYNYNSYAQDPIPWLTPDQARRAVEIAREEIYEWLQEHSQEYVYWMDEEFGKDDLINDLKKHLEGKVWQYNNTQKE